MKEGQLLLGCKIVQGLLVVSVMVVVLDQVRAVCSFAWCRWKGVVKLKY